MPHLVRKIEIAKWKPEERFEIANVPSDAITGSLRTQKNALSVWQFSYDDREKVIKEGTLALVTGPLVKDIDTYHLVLINPDELENKQLDITTEDGSTHVEDLIHAHRNIPNLTYDKLGRIAGIILQEIYADKVKMMSKSDIADIIIEAIKENRLEFDKLNQKVQKAILMRCKQLNIDTEFLFE